MSDDCNDNVPLCDCGCCGETTDTPSPPDPPSEEELALIAKFKEEEANARTITEEDRVHEEWYAQTKDLRTTDDLVAFIHHLLHDYNHDYGTIVHAVTAAALAAAKVVDRDPRQGGITGFQASCVMWSFLRYWLLKEGPMRLVEYDLMLYPQYAERFATVIQPETWAYLQKKAEENLADPNCGNENVREHWRSIVDGNVPFGYTVKETE